MQGRVEKMLQEKGDPDRAHFFAKEEEVVLFSLREEIDSERYTSSCDPRLVSV